MRNNDPGGALAGTRICMVAYSYYPMDQRVRREADILKENGAHVHVICLRNVNEKGFDIYNDIRIYRVPQKIDRSGGYLSYFLRYSLFLLLSTIFLNLLFMKFRYKIVHVHSLPDFEVFCGFIPKLFKSHIILDLHENMPEVLASRFDVSTDSKPVAVAKLIEKLSVLYADIIITTSQNRKELIIKRTKKKDVVIVMNLPKKEIFKSKDMSDFIVKNNLKESFIVCFVGGLNPEREIDVVIKAIKYIEEKVPKIAFVFCGTGEEEYIVYLKRLIENLHLQKKVIYMGYVPQDLILNYISLSNVTLNPYKIHPNLNPVGSTKIFEYLLVSKPVIVPDYPANRKEFEDLVLFYKSSDYKNLGDKILEVYMNEEHYKKMAERAHEVLFKRYDPKKNEEKLVKAYRNLIFNG